MTHRSNEHTVSVVLTIAAVGCTAYTAVTNWHFADHYLGMNSALERTLFVLAGALALVANVSMARLRHSGLLPHFLIWAITGFHVVAAYVESGLIAGTVRAFIGPLLAVVLWHLVLGHSPSRRVSAAERAGLSHTRPPELQLRQAG